MIGLFLLATNGFADWDSGQWVAVITAIGTQVALIVGLFLKYKSDQVALARIEAEQRAAKGLAATATEKIATVDAKVSAVAETMAPHE